MESPRKGLVLCLQSTCTTGITGVEEVKVKLKLVFAVRNAQIYAVHVTMFFKRGCALPARRLRLWYQPQTATQTVNSHTVPRLLSFHNRFLHYRAVIISVIHELLKADHKWEMSRIQQRTFQKPKKLLSVRATRPLRLV